MTCVLRISTPSLTTVLARVALSPYRIENNTAHFAVSDAELDDLSGQVRDAISYLTANHAAIEELMAVAEATGELDLATEYEAGSFTSRAVPAALIQLAGRLGLGITVSGYPTRGPS